MVTKRERKREKKTNYHLYQNINHLDHPHLTRPNSIHPYLSIHNLIHLHPSLYILTQPHSIPTHPQPTSLHPYSSSPIHTHLHPSSTKLTNTLIHLHPHHHTQTTLVSQTTTFPPSTLQPIKSPVFLTCLKQGSFGCDLFLHCSCTGEAQRRSVMSGVVQLTYTHPHGVHVPLPCHA